MSKKEYQMVKNVPAIFGSMVFNDDVMRERLPKEVYKSIEKNFAIQNKIITNDIKKELDKNQNEFIKYVQK